jgi:hypothetical protein
LRQWLETTERPRGAVVAPQVVYDLGKNWYWTRFDVDWEPATPEQATEMFARHGLTGEFWAPARRA